MLLFSAPLYHGEDFSASKQKIPKMPDIFVCIYMCILSQKGDALGNKYISEFLYLNSKATGTSSWNEFELDCF